MQQFDGDKFDEWLASIKIFPNIIFLLQFEVLLVGIWCMVNSSKFSPSIMCSGMFHEGKSGEFGESLAIGTKNNQIISYN